MTVLEKDPESPDEQYIPLIKRRRESKRGAGYNETEDEENQAT